VSKICYLDLKQHEEKFVGSKRERYFVSECCNIYYFEIILTSQPITYQKKNALELHRHYTLNELRSAARTLKPFASTSGFRI
jgi:hypothetical protein